MLIAVVGLFVLLKSSVDAGGASRRQIDKALPPLPDLYIPELLEPAHVYNTLVYAEWFFNLMGICDDHVAACKCLHELIPARPKPQNRNTCSIQRLDAPKSAFRHIDLAYIGQYIIESLKQLGLCQHEQGNACKCVEAAAAVLSHPEGVANRRLSGEVNLAQQKRTIEAPDYYYPSKLPPGEIYNILVMAEYYLQMLGVCDFASGLCKCLHEIIPPKPTTRGSCSADFGILRHLAKPKPTKRLDHPPIRQYLIDAFQQLGICNNEKGNICKCIVASAPQTERRKLLRVNGSKCCG